MLRVGERFHLAAMIIKVSAMAPSPVDVQLKCRRAALCPSVLLGIHKKEELEEDTKTCFCEEDDAGTNLKSENFHGNLSQEVEKNDCHWKVSFDSSSVGYTFRVYLHQHLVQPK